MRDAYQKMIRFFGSFKLAVVLLLFLLVLTFLGTIEQADMSLYDVQKKYFESWFLTWQGIPLPGATLVLGLLALNLVVGGLWRMRKGTSTYGILVIHVGILVLLATGFVENRLARKGHMTLYEGQSSDEFASYFDWDVVVTEHLEQGRIREHVIPDDRFDHLGPSEVARATSDGLPFDLELRGFARNALPRPLDALSVERGLGVDGWVLEARRPEPKAEGNIAGLQVTLVEKDGGARTEALLWGLQRYPFVTDVDGRRFSVDLRKRRWPVPFRIHLDDFVHEMHPGTRMARRFSSYVEKIQGGLVQTVHITMNEPLRDGGFTFYQSGWGPEDAQPGQPLFSTFAVVETPSVLGIPSHRFPLISCIIIAVGLLMHWIRRLVLYLQAEARRREHAPTPAAGVAVEGARS